VPIKSRHPLWIVIRRTMELFDPRQKWPLRLDVTGAPFSNLPVMPGNSPGLGLTLLPLVWTPPPIEPMGLAPYTIIMGIRGAVEEYPADRHLLQSSNIFCQRG
jgi:hypothetical protein